MVIKLDFCYFLEGLLFDEVDKLGLEVDFLTGDKVENISLFGNFHKIEFFD